MISKVSFRGALDWRKRGEPTHLSAEELLERLGDGRDYELDAGEGPLAERADYFHALEKGRSLEEGWVLEEGQALEERRRGYGLRERHRRRDSAEGP
jgi:hypothetical protein